MGTLAEKIYEGYQSGKKSLALLLDPDEYNIHDLELLFEQNLEHVSYIFVGGSLLLDNNSDAIIERIKELTKKPVILFPGSSTHISAQADAILFLSLLSGRNPEFLIGQQVISAPIIKKAGLEVISTAYLLVDGGPQTTVQYISNTNPLPRNKPDIAACTALAAQYLGFDLIYLDSGSGAEYQVPKEIISAVRKEIDLPIIVGGGLRSYDDMEKSFSAGADIVVIGNAVQNKEIDLSELKA